MTRKTGQKSDKAGDAHGKDKKPLLNPEPSQKSQPQRAGDEVEEASMESFPASDPPAYYQMRVGASDENKDRKKGDDGKEKKDDPE